MAITKWGIGLDPFTQFATIRDRFNKIFEDGLIARGDDEGLPLSAWSPAVDIYETENEVVIKAELPGLNQEDIDIQVSDNTLTIKGERKQESTVKKENFHRIERVYGSFQRTFTLPHTIKQEDIRATYKSGLLTLNLPKVEETKPKQIKVKIE